MLSVTREVPSVTSTSSPFGLFNVCGAVSSRAVCGPRPDCAGCATAHMRILYAFLFLLRLLPETLNEQEQLDLCVLYTWDVQRDIETAYRPLASA